MKKFAYILLIAAILPESCRQWIEEHTGRGANFQDATRLTFLGGALTIYTDVHGKMPSNITDKEGKPLLSWRVDLLQDAGDREIELYKQFKLDEPWNSPHNMKVAQTVPFMYIDAKGSRCTPLSSGQIEPMWRMDPKALNHTPYLAVIGPKTAFGLKKLPKKDSGYAAVVVVDKSDVFWSEPRDISVEEVKKGESLRWYGGKVIRYLAADGSTRLWGKDSAERVRRDWIYTPNYEYKSGE